MAISNSMLIRLTTVVDITETRARRGEDKKKENQQANYNTMIQTIGLRINPEPVGLQESIIDVTDLGFGSAIKGKQRVWTFEFDNPYDGGLDESMLTNDFDLVPVIKDLNETAPIQNAVFSTTHPADKNIIFELLT
jgi:hypothetical protein